jgi:long-subunit acyl-CoA synthetase (AMP-forming)
MLSHDNLVFSQFAATMAITGETGVKHPEDRAVSYLPLSHIAGFCFDVVAPLIQGTKIYYARPDALQGTLL